MVSKPIFATPSLRSATRFARMSVGSKLVIAGLAIGCIGLGIWYFLQTRKNYSTAIGQRLIPFTAAIDPTTGLAGPFTNPAGEPQLQCPAGTTINIVGAFFDISDPYGECSAKPSAFIQGMCDPSVATPQACTPGSSGAASGCNPYQYCNSSGFCQLNSQNSAASCIPDSNGIPYSPLTIGGSVYCVPTDVCNGSINLSQPGIPNNVCSVASASGSLNQCATRDATDSVGAKCNGRPECSDLTMTDFGPYPCPGLSPTTGGCIQQYDSYGNPIWSAQRTGYCGLPYLPGWAGGPPTAPQGGSNSGQSNPASSTLGYFMHGLYACV